MVVSVGLIVGVGVSVDVSVRVEEERGFEVNVTA